MKSFFSLDFLKPFVISLFFSQFKILNVPMSSQLAANHWNQQQAEQEERMRMKKLTLDINERQEQEDYQGIKSFPGQKWKIVMLFGFCYSLPFHVMFVYI